VRKWEERRREDREGEERGTVSSKRKR